MSTTLSLRYCEGEEAKIVDLDINLVEPDPDQVRTEFDEDQISALGETYDEGLITPIRVYRYRSKYRIISGERRYRAALIKGKETIPAIVLSKRPSKDALKMEQLTEEFHHSELSWMEKARGMAEVAEKRGLDSEMLAKLFRISLDEVEGILSLMKLSTKVQTLLARKKISYGACLQIASLPYKEDQNTAADFVLEEQLSVPQTEQLVRRLKRERVAASRKVEDSPPPPRTRPRRSRPQAAVSSHKSGRGEVIVKTVPGGGVLEQLNAVEQVAQELHQQVLEQKGKSKVQVRRKITLTVLEELLDAFSGQGSTALKAAVDSELASIGSLIARQLLSVLSHEDPSVRSEASKLLNGLSRETRLTLEYLRKDR